MSQAASGWFETLEGRRLLSAFNADINFQPAASPVPSGYAADSGAVYGAMSDGMSYGWNGPHPAQVVEHHIKKPSDGPDERYDTFAAMHFKGKGSAWMMAVPDGTYDVSITTGDPRAFSGYQAVDVNGSLVVAGKATRAARWVSGTGEINVTNGFITLTVPRGRTAKIDFVDISQVVTTPPPVTPTTDTPFTTPFSTGALIPAAEYDQGGEGISYHDTTPTNLGGDDYRSPDAVDIETGAVAPHVVTDVDTGEWLNYTLDVPTAGQYVLSTDVSNSAAGGSFHASVAGTNLTGAIAVPNTSGDSTFTTMTSAPFTLAAGSQIMQIDFDQTAGNGNVGNFNTFELQPYTPPSPTGESPYSGTPFNTNQTIPAIDYNLGGEGVAYHDSTPANLGNSNLRPGDGVDISTGGASGEIVGYTAPGEYLDYTINVATAGSYQLSSSATNTDAGAQFHAQIAGVNLTGAMAVPKNANFTTYGTVTSNTFQLSAGVQVLRIVMDTAAANAAVGNFDWFQIIPAPTSSLSPLVWTTKHNNTAGLAEAKSVGFNGKLYVFGGYFATEPEYQATTACEAYNPATDSWATLAPMPVPTTHMGIATDGTYIYIVGGYTYNPKTTYQTFATTNDFRYDPATNTWATFVPLPQPRGAGDLEFLNGQLHFFDGLNVQKLPQTDHWALDLTSANPQWVASTPTPFSRNHLSGAVLDGKIYAMGGRYDGDDLADPAADCIVWDPTNPGVWTPIASLPQIRALAVSAVVDGKIYLMGGTSTSYQPISSVLVYDPTTNTWTVQTPLPATRLAPCGGAIGNMLIVTTGLSQTLQATTWTAVVT
ncbi:MAG TPA: carbohydrate-binding protein [Tepidisphaeraceae bacterium]|nr:carbohydrate-binding protein [Tepidisphaeraceae bacterium]